MTRSLRLLATVAAGALVLAGCGSDSKSNALDGAKLTGLFALSPGVCGGADATGSTFRMVQPGGTVSAGPFVVNGDSSCAGGNITLMQPGIDGGLKTGEYQPTPDVAFDGNGNGLSNKITQPTKFFAVNFALATNKKDPQTKKPTSLPTVTVDGNKLRADLSAVAASWNGQHFNQGAPKPGQKLSDATEARGTFDPSTKAYTLDWSSKIVGGPFNNFIGVWHLEGIFTAA